MEKYDFVIIGSGASGATVAEKLSSNYKVLILEKGQHLSLNEAHKSYVRTSQNKDFGKHGGVDILSGTAVGGTTLLAIANGVRAQEKELKSLGIDLKKELDEVERDLSIKKIPENMLGGRTKLFIEKAKELEIFIDRMKEEMKERHLMRLRDGICKVDPGLVMVDLISTFEKLGDLCFNVAQAVAGRRS